MPKLITVVYEITDESEWAKTNPLQYRHNGLSAVRVGVGDAIEAQNALRDLLPFAQEDYYPNCATPEFKAAMEAAEKAVEVKL